MARTDVEAERDGALVDAALLVALAGALCAPAARAPASAREVPDSDLGVPPVRAGAESESGREADRADAGSCVFFVGRRDAEGRFWCRTCGLFVELRRIAEPWPDGEVRVRCPRGADEA